MVTTANDIQADGKFWQEIGNIDTKGHEEQAGMVKRIDELFEQVQEALEVAFERGIQVSEVVQSPMEGLVKYHLPQAPKGVSK